MVYEILDKGKKVAYNIAVIRSSYAVLDGVEGLDLFKLSSLLSCIYHEDKEVILNDLVAQRKEILKKENV